MSLNQYPEWVKYNELNAIQSREIITLKDRIKRLEAAGDELIDYLKHRIKTDHLNPIWHTASIKWGKVKKEAKP